MNAIQILKDRVNNIIHYRQVNQHSDERLTQMFEYIREIKQAISILESVKDLPMPHIPDNKVLEYIY